jgi:hypothetical protein
LVVPAFTPVHVVLPEHHELGIVRQIGRKVKTLRPSAYLCVLCVEINFDAEGAEMRGGPQRKTRPSYTSIA